MCAHASVRVRECSNCSLPQRLLRATTSWPPSYNLYQEGSRTQYIYIYGVSIILSLQAPKASWVCLNHLVNRAKGVCFHWVVHVVLEVQRRLPPERNLQRNHRGRQGWQPPDLCKGSTLLNQLHWQRPPHHIPCHCQVLFLLQRYKLLLHRLYRVVCHQLCTDRLEACSHCIWCRCSSSNLGCSHWLCRADPEGWDERCSFHD